MLCDNTIKVCKLHIFSNAYQLKRYMSTPNTFRKTYELMFEIGDIVFLKTDPDQMERIVVGIEIYDNSISYSLCSGTSQSLHFGFEISDERDVVKAITS